MIYKLKSSDITELNPKYSDSPKTFSVIFTLSLWGLYNIQKHVAIKLALLTFGFFRGCTLYLFNVSYDFFNSYYQPRLRTVRLLHLSCARDTDFVQLTFTKSINIFQIFFCNILICFSFPSLYFMDEKMDFSIKITLENFVNIALA